MFLSMDEYDSSQLLMVPLFCQLSHINYNEHITETEWDRNFDSKLPLFVTVKT